ncbi:MAG: hypothetical protein ACT4QF_18070 [Sporichthyaceae bacterium]
MTDDDLDDAVEMAPPREQAWAAVVVCSALIGALLVLFLLGGALHDFYELSYLCDERGCEVDSRPWARRHLGQLWQLGALAGCVAVFWVALRKVRRLRRAALDPASPLN